MTERDNKEREKLMQEFNNLGDNIKGLGKYVGKSERFIKEGIKQAKRDLDQLQENALKNFGTPGEQGEQEYGKREGKGVGNYLAQSSQVTGLGLMAGTIKDVNERFGGTFKVVEGEHVVHGFQLVNEDGVKVDVHW